MEAHLRDQNKHAGGDFKSFDVNKISNNPSKSINCLEELCKSSKIYTKCH